MRNDNENYNELGNALLEGTKTPRVFGVFSCYAYNNRNLSSRTEGSWGISLVSKWVTQMP